MKITLNDSPRETAAGTVEALVAEVLGEVPAAGTAVAVDGAVVPRSAWSSTGLDQGARVDILTAVQGG
ncbi:sulfur carrier protein ThiS [Corynebacterium senegalense]|uniref:sulfur carrier protein ThiS n=1 Tax=Corynebacterium senegalense TaxID=2080750 RepID=UPI000E1FC912|nr:sulfur carrier protein ThiS [Corynebacterium senegalense]